VREAAKNLEAKGILLKNQHREELREALLKQWKEITISRSPRQTMIPTTKCVAVGDGGVGKVCVDDL
jgi:hypothetical protein